MLDYHLLLWDSQCLYVPSFFQYYVNGRVLLFCEIFLTATCIVCETIFLVSNSDSKSFIIIIIISTLNMSDSLFLIS